MTVTKIEPLTKIKFKVYLDGSFAFVLYKGELSRFGIRRREQRFRKRQRKGSAGMWSLRGRNCGPCTFWKIWTGQRRDCGKSCSQGLYPEDAAEEAVRYVKSFGYLDDSRYAENFVRSRQGSKSRREIQALLLQKGDFRG